MPLHPIYVWGAQTWPRGASYSFGAVSRGLRVDLGPSQLRLLRPHGLILLNTLPSD